MTLFQSEWWLDAVAPGRWEYVQASGARGSSAWLPYVVKRERFGVVRLLAPPLTPRLGPQLRHGETTRSRQLLTNKELLLSLADQLPRHDQFLQNFSSDVEYWVPLSWRGFTQTTYYSFVLPNLADLDSVRAGFSRGVRSDIVKAERTLVVRDGSTDELYQLVRRTLSSRGKPVPFEMRDLARAHAAASSRQQSRIICAYDESDRVVAGLFLLWDDQSAYYLLGGTAANSHGSGAPSMLLWHAIRFAATVSRVFDFEGSRVESIESYFRSFGGVPTPYSRVQHLSRRMHAMMSTRTLMLRR